MKESSSLEEDKGLPSSLMKESSSLEEDKDLDRILGQVVTW